MINSFQVFSLVISSILLFCLFLLYIINVSILIYYEALLRKTPFVPTSLKKNKENLNELFKFLDSLHLENKKFVDLGSGDGKIVIEFAKKGYLSYGIEINPFLFFLSKLKSRSLKNTTLIRGDIFKFNLRDFDVVYIYQTSSMNQRLKDKFEKELKPGSIIISHIFKFPESDRIKLVKEIGEGKFLIYQKFEPGRY